MHCSSRALFWLYPLPSHRTLVPKEVNNAFKLLFRQLPTAGAQWLWASWIRDPGAPDTLLYNHIPWESPIHRAQRGGRRTEGALFPHRMEREAASPRMSLSVLQREEQRPQPIPMLPEFLWLSVLCKADNHTVTLAHPCYTERTGTKIKI